MDRKAAPSRSCNIDIVIQHLALEVAGERHRVVFVFELKTEAGLPAGQKSDLEENG